MIDYSGFPLVKLGVIFTRGKPQRVKLDRIRQNERSVAVKFTYLGKGNEEEIQIANMQQIESSKLPQYFLDFVARGQKQVIKMKLPLGQQPNMNQKKATENFDGALFDKLLAVSTAQNTQMLIAFNGKSADSYISCFTDLNPHVQPKAYDFSNFPPKKLAIALKNNKPWRVEVTKSSSTTQDINITIRYLQSDESEALTLNNVEEVQNSDIPRQWQKLFQNGARSLQKMNLQPDEMPTVDQSKVTEDFDGGVFSVLLRLSTNSGENKLLSVNDKTAASMCNCFSCGGVQSAQNTSNNAIANTLSSTGYQMPDRNSTEDDQQATQPPGAQFTGLNDQLARSALHQDDLQATTLQPSDYPMSCISLSAKKPKMMQLLEIAENSENLSFKLQFSEFEVTCYGVEQGLTLLDEKLAKKITKLQEKAEKASVKKANVQECDVTLSKYTDLNLAILSAVLVFRNDLQPFAFSPLNARKITSFLSRKPLLLQQPDAGEAVGLKLQGDSVVSLRERSGELLDSVLSQPVKCVHFNGQDNPECEISLRSRAGKSLVFLYKKSATDEQELIVNDAETTLHGRTKQKFQQYTGGGQPLRLITEGGQVLTLVLSDQAWVDACMRELRGKEEAPEVDEQDSAILTQAGDLAREPSTSPRSEGRAAGRALRQNSPEPPTGQPTRAFAKEQAPQPPPQPPQLQTPVMEPRSPPAEIPQVLRAANLCLIEQQGELLRGFFKLSARQGKRVLLLKTCCERLYASFSVQGARRIQSSQRLRQLADAHGKRLRAALSAQRGVSVDQSDCLGPCDLAVLKNCVSVLCSNESIIRLLVDDDVAGCLLDALR